MGFKATLTVGLTTGGHMAKGDMLKKKHHVTQELADVIGTVKASRGDVTKRVWAYIKKHGLQGCKEGDRRNIYPDECLGRVLGGKKIDMLKMTSKVSEHILDEA